MCIRDSQLNGVTLENVDHFSYLGSYLSTRADTDAEIQHHLSSVSVFEDQDIRKKTKMLVYKAIVLPTLLHACETWTTYKSHLQLLERFHQRCLPKKLHTAWEDMQTITSVLEEAKITSVEAMILQHQLCWIGHVVQMPDYRLPKQLFRT